MELKEFVSQALSVIAEGVQVAKDSLGDKVSIATTGGTNVSKMPDNTFIDYAGRIYSLIEFDVAVTTVDAVKGGGGISVLPFKLGGEVEGRAETASRIKFTLTMAIN